MDPDLVFFRRHVTSKSKSHIDATVERRHYPKPIGTTTLPQTAHTRTQPQCLHIEPSEVFIVQDIRL